MWFFEGLQSWLDDVVTDIQDTVERVIYDPCGPLEGIKDIVEEKEREREYEELERKIQNDEWEEETEDDSILRELFGAVRELKESMEEIFTVGAYEIFVKGNTEWKPSGDIMDEARQLVEEATEMYNVVYKETKAKLDQLEEHIKIVNENKRKLAEKLQRQIQADDKSWNLNKGYLFAPEFKKTSNGYMGIPTLLGDGRTYIKDVLGFSALPVNLLSTGFLGQSRIQIAKENLEDAKDFVVKVQVKVTKLQEIMVRISEIEVVLKEEEAVLETLLRKNMNNEEANLYAEQLKVLLAEEIVNKEGFLNVNYTNTVEKLECVLNKRNT